MGLIEVLTGAKRALPPGVFTDVGKVRKDNQDSFFVSPSGRLFAVCDGMGGGQGGAEASAIACRMLGEAEKRAGKKSFRETARAIDESFTAINDEIRKTAFVRGYSMMGTTAVILLRDVENPRQALVAHIGDSRAYRFREGRLELLTRDHTVEEELRNLERGKNPRLQACSRATPLSHVLTRCLGVDREVGADWRRLDVEKGDRYILCSDGLHDMLDDETIAEIVDAGGSDAEIASRLGKAALDAGGHDNVTLVVRGAE